MARIFLSHSGQNNAEALALREWLVGQGWTDLFLDIHPTEGLVAADRWQSALRASIGRCRAVIFCLSPEWAASPNCISEFNQAIQIGAAPVGVVVRPVALDRIPGEMTKVWQLVDLTRGGKPVEFTVAPPPARKPQTVTFPHEELLRLRAGLGKLGLIGFETTSFPWPPPEEPARAPYRGLKPLDLNDAGIFFGRDDDLVRAREELLALRGRGGRQVFVILGASGSGKSSFLRAGLLPRLKREDRDFIVLPTVRPEIAAISGDQGLANSLVKAFEELGQRRALGEIKDALNTDPDALLRLLADIAGRTGGQLIGEGKSQVDRDPTILLPIDQAEELMTVETTVASEARKALGHLSVGTLRGPELIAVLTIRTDRFSELQNEPILRTLPQHLFNLPPVTPFAFREAIVGPAVRATPPLEIDPVLVERLIADTATQGADPLPLLAFTLERLYLEYGRASPRLKPEHYDRIGGIDGSIEAALAEAFARPDAPPTIPADEAQRNALLEAAFIPALVDINDANREPLRRIALESELPPDARNLLARLIEKRLLVKGTRTSAEGHAENTIEVAHEALLRRWRTMRDMLDRHATALKTIQGVERAAATWNSVGRTPDWLTHEGLRLAEASEVSQKPLFASRFTGLTGAYLLACRDKADKDRLLEERRQSRETRRSRVIRSGVALALVFAAVGYLLFSAWNAQLVIQSQYLADLSGQYDRQKDDTTAMLLAIEGLPDQGTDQITPRLRPYLPEVERNLDFALRNRRAGIMLDVGSAAFSPDGKRLLVAHAGEAPAILDLGDGHVVARLSEISQHPFVLDFSSDGSRALTVDTGAKQVIFDAATGEKLGSIAADAMPYPDSRKALDFVPDDSGPTTLSIVDVAGGASKELFHKPVGHAEAKLSAHGQYAALLTYGAGLAPTIQLWNAAGNPVATLPFPAQVATDQLADSGDPPKFWLTTDEKLAAALTADKKLLIWDLATGKLLHTIDQISASTADKQGKVNVVSIESILEQNIGSARVLVLGSDGAPQVIDLATGVIGAKLGETRREGLSAVSTIAGDRVLTFSDSGPAVLWDTQTGREVARLPDIGASLSDATFSADGQKLLTVSIDNQIHLWTLRGREITLSGLLSHGQMGKVLDEGFSADGSWARVETERSVQIWPVGDHALAPLLTVPGGRLASLAYSGDGNRTLMASGIGPIHVWNRQSGEAVLNLDVGKTIQTASLSRDGSRLFAVLGDGTARIVDVASGRDLKRLAPPTGTFVSGEMSASGSSVVSVSSDRSVQVWAADAGTLTATFGREAIAASLSPDEQTVLTRQTDGSLSLWQAQTGKFLHYFGASPRKVTAAVFSANGQQLIAGLSDGTLQTFDLALSEPPRVMQSSDQSEVVALSPTTDGTRILASFKSGRIQLFNTDSGLLIAEPGAGGGTYALSALSPDGQELLLSDDAGRVYAPQLFAGTQDLLTAAKAAASRCLTVAERRRFHLQPEAPPRWCHEMSKWPYQEANAAGPAAAWYQRPMLDAGDLAGQFDRWGRKRLGLPGGAEQPGAPVNAGTAHELAAPDLATVGVSWPIDALSPDYNHLESLPSGGTFEVTPEDFDVLIAANSFKPVSAMGDKILFGLRGADLAAGASFENAAKLVLKDARPDHKDFHCVIGIYDRKNHLLSGYTASTVPNDFSVMRYFKLSNGIDSNSGFRANLLPTGSYVYRIGKHRHVDPAFQLGDSNGKGGQVTILRSRDDASYSVWDYWDRTMPGDNIHSAYSNESFSSAGTQTVRGTDGTGDWDKFIKALGLSRPGSAADSGKRIDYVLLTGLEAATASALRVGGQSKDVAVVQAKLGRLRQGSDGPAVAKLRAALGMTPGTSFDAETASKLVDLQHARLGYADAIYSPRMECALSLGVLQRPADCKGQLANAISLLPNPTAKLSGAEPPPRPRDHPALERTTELVAALTRPAATSAHLSTQTLALPANSSSNEVAASLALTGDRLSRFAPKARADYLRAMVQSGDGILARYSINTNSRRLCHFLAQVAHESNGYVISEESPDYGSAARLAQIWPRRFPTTEAAAPFVHNPEALANKIYGGSLGNTQPGDGYRYRGRGLIQITGRATYRDMGRAIGVDLEASPDLAAEGEKAFMIAAGYWNSRANADGQTMNELADANNIAMITRRLNGGLNGLADRRQWFEKCWAIWGEGPQPQSGPAETDDQPAPDAPDPEPTP